MTDLTVAVMAGGKSSRMGTDKAFVPLLGKPLIEHVLGRTAGLGQRETFIVANDVPAYNHLGLQVFPDIVPDKGPLGGIYTALHHSRSRYTLVVATDMPFLEPAFLAFMRDRAPGYDVVVPRIERYPQGLHAVYSRDCTEPIEAQLAGPRLKVIGFYGKVRTLYLDEADYARVDPFGLALRNVNTPDELEDARNQASTLAPETHT